MKLVILAIVTLVFIGCGNSNSQSSEKKSEVTSVSTQVSKKRDEVSIKAKGMTLNATNKAEEVVKKVVVKTEEVASDLSAKAVVVTKKMTTEVVEKAKAVVATANSSAGATIFKSCAGCHGQHGEKRALGKSEIIKGWSMDKVQTAINAYKIGARNKHGMGMIMKGQTSKLSDLDIKAVSEYISEL